MRWKWAAVRHLDKPRAVRLDGVWLTTDAREVTSDPEVDVVIETIGGTDQALEYALAALAAGKHVVTANKALLAEHGTEVFAHAQAAGERSASRRASAAAFRSSRHWASRWRPTRFRAWPPSSTARATSSSPG